MKTIGLAWIILEISKFISQWVPIESSFSEDWKIILNGVWIVVTICLGLPLFSWEGRRRAKAIEEGDVKIIKYTRYSTVLNATVSLSVFIFINQGIILAGIMALIIFAIFHFVCKGWEKREIANAQRKKGEHS